MLSVRRVVLRGAAPDGVAARLRCERLLGGVEAPLPRGAIACVRRHRDASPRGADLERVDALAARSWRAANAAALAAALRRAARPSAGPVPPSAEAVVFADEAELLACLTLDWMRGEVALRWWWQALLGAWPGKSALVERWRRGIRHAPAALATLAAAGHAREWVEQLSRDEALGLAGELAHAFAIERLLGAVDVEAPRHGASRPSPAKAAAGAGPAARPAPRECPPPPWERRVAECRSLDPARGFFLAAGLLLARDAALLRSRELASEWLAWAGGGPSASRTHAGSRLRSSGSGPSRGSRAGAGVGERGPRPAAATNEERDPAAAPDHGATRVARTEGSRVDALRLVPTSEVAPRREARREATPRGERIIETGFGGAFYLLNLALWLELYADFTRPRGDALELPIGDFVASLALALVPSAPREDPLWRFLRGPGPAPRGTFVAPRGWRPPPEWSDAFGDRTARAHERKRRLLGARARRPWFRALASGVRVRLARALGVSPARAGRLAIEQHARVEAAPARLDVHFALDGHPIALRLAGLDRDPGWIPALGRDVRFHYD